MIADSLCCFCGICWDFSSFLSVFHRRRRVFGFHDECRIKSDEESFQWVTVFKFQEVIVLIAKGI